MMDLWITKARYLGAWLRTRGVDTTQVAAYRANAPQDTFYIIGAGGTVNDLSEADIAAIEAGTSACINMAAVAPIAFDLYSLELVAHEAHYSAIATKLRAQDKPALIWFQNRAKHETNWLAQLESEFPLFRYTRVSVSVRRKLANWQAVWQHFVAPRVLKAPDLALGFAVTGSVARLTLLALSLGYRRIGFVGVDLGSTPYFWLEERPLRGKPQWVDGSGVYSGVSIGAVSQTSATIVPNVTQFLASLHQTIPDLDLFTLDPAARSNLTGHLKTP